MRSLSNSILLVFVTFAASARAQVVGEDTFICSPTAFEFTLNFAGGCPGTIEPSPGIVGSDCTNFANITADNIPVSVRSVQVLELDTNLNNLDVTNFIGAFTDGDTIDYSSVSSEEITDPADVPGGLQLNINGVNAVGQTIVNSIILEYTNAGTYSPILNVGDQIGWIVFSELVPARPEYCPAVTLAPTTVAPTTSPVTPAPESDAPTAAPVTNSPVTTAPTDAPVVAPVEPTGSPVAPVAPTESPVAPVVAPTDPPVVAPTNPPVVAPVAPTESPVAPVVPPVEPTESPVAPVEPPVAPVEPPVAPVVAPVEPTESPVAPVEPPVAPVEPTSPVAPPTDPTDAPVSPVSPPVAPPVSAAPFFVETPYPTDFSMSFDFARSKSKKGGKKSKKKKTKGTKKSKDMGDDDDDYEMPKTKGKKSGKTSSSKDETEGALSKGDDDDDDGNDYSLRAAGRDRGEQAGYFGRRRLKVQR